MGLIKVRETFSSFPLEQQTHLGYELDLGLNKDERPLSIAAEGSADDFLKTIEKELKERSLDRTKYFTAIQLYDADEYIQKQ